MLPDTDRPRQTPRWWDIARHRCATAAGHVLARCSRVYLRRHTVATTTGRHASRASMLSAWAGAEDALAHTQRALHENHTATGACPRQVEGRCCDALIRRREDRAAVLHALAQVERHRAEPAPGASLNMSLLPMRMRGVADVELAALAAAEDGSRLMVAGWVLWVVLSGSGLDPDAVGLVPRLYC